jgi:WD40-like Beta Propeller Repeat
MPAWRGCAGERGRRRVMATADVVGSAPVVEPVADSRWRAACARASVVFGVFGLVVLAVVAVADLTFWLDSVPGVAGFLSTEAYGYFVVLAACAASVVGLVTGFLGRRSRRRRNAIAGSALSGVVFLASICSGGGGIPYEPGISGLAWSPDGTRIAYAHTWAAYPDGEDGIWVVAADGSSEPTHLVGRGSAPDWSPDGTTIAYREAGDLSLMDADGSNPRKLTAPGQHEGLSAWFETGHSWSPDGSQIVFAGNPGAGEGSEGIWIISTDGQNLRQVTSDGRAPDWSPDGTQIAYYTSEGGRVCAVINIDGTGRTQLPGDVWTGDPQWTSDGRIAVNCPEGLCVMDADGSNRQVLCPGPSWTGEPSTVTGTEGKPSAYESGRILSPDGTRVAYVTGPGIKSDIVVTTIDGTNQITLIH